jgi:hypothetical protein
MLPIIDRFSFSVIKAGSSISLQIRWFEIAAVSRQAFDDSADVRRHAEELKRGRQIILPEDAAEFYAASLE